VLRDVTDPEAADFDDPVSVSLTLTLRLRVRLRLRLRLRVGLRDPYQVPLG